MTLTHCHNTIQIWAIGVLLLFSFSGLKADQPPSYDIYLTRYAENGIPSREAHTDFDCSDRIYLVVEANNLTTEEHDLQVRWFNPVGDQQERTDYSFQAYPFTRIWAWLQLSGPPGAVIGQVFDPAFGMEEFIGEWQTKITIDKKKIDDVEFNVLC